MEKATFAAGCFWGVQDTFDKIKGVVSTRVGYTGGSVPNPTYQMVCADNTGHAEAIEIEFDPNVVSYSELLNIFWQIHDPTTLDRQGPDEGSQYRSSIFTHSSEQQAEAMDSKELLAASKRFHQPVVTHILPAKTFWPAEEYHQKYFAKQGIKGACHYKRDE
jgi:peptide-methionine (S)-S-oxide reductase